MGARGPVNWLHMLHTVFATMLIAAGTATLNHYIERDSDRFMRRTAGRPLPTGVVQPREALIFGVVLSIAGAIDLYFVGGPLACALGRRHLPELSPRLHSAEEAHRVGHLYRRFSRRHPADDWLGRCNWFARSRRLAAFRHSVSSGSFRISTPSPGCTAKTTRAQAS